MKINNAQVPKSSFLSIEKDMDEIMNRIYNNPRIKRLLYYTTRDALQKKELVPEDVDLTQNIKIVPKLIIDNSVLNYIIISADNFIPSGNPEFRDNIIEFDIICHFDQWQLENNCLRPYKIAGELDAMFNNTKMPGIGTLQFIGANQMILTDEFAGLCLMYQAVHGGEDKVNIPDRPGSTENQEHFIKDFQEYIKNEKNNP